MGRGGGWLLWYGTCLLVLYAAGGPIATFAFGVGMFSASVSILSTMPGPLRKLLAVYVARFLDSVDR